MRETALAGRSGAVTPAAGLVEAADGAFDAEWHPPERLFVEVARGAAVAGVTLDPGTDAHALLDGAGVLLEATRELVLTGEDLVGARTQPNDETEQGESIKHGGGIVHARCRRHDTR
jgi:hypothetical protein